jgi:hypothetical protein
VGSLQLATKPSEVVEQPRVSTIPIWLYPQALSLDAPLVAVLWQMLFARSFGVTVSPLVLGLTAACVWMIYVIDHLMDLRAGVMYSERHRFAARHRIALWSLITVALATSVLGCLRLPMEMLRGGVRLVGAVALYLAIVHFAKDSRRYWPKEIVIGVVFALGSSIAAWTSPSTSASPLHVIPAIALFAALCTLNVAAVDCWEWRSHRVLVRYPHTFTRWIERHFEYLAFMIALVAAGSAAALPTLMMSILVSALLLIGVARIQPSLPPEAARLLADASLLTPLLFLVR